MASDTIDAFVKYIQSRVPGFRVSRKEDSRLMRLLGKILFFTPDFMGRYTTTMGNTVYLTDHLWDNNSVWVTSTLAHEAQHVHDKQRCGTLLFGFAYLLPQILAVLSLLSVLAIWFSSAWLWSLASLALLAPIPAYFRMVIERRGYLMTLCVSWWIGGEHTARSELDRVLNQFTGPAYYFMWPFRKGLRAWFEKELPEKAKHPSQHNTIYILVFDFIAAHRTKGERK